MSKSYSVYVLHNGLKVILDIAFVYNHEELYNFDDWLYADRFDRHKFVRDFYYLDEHKFNEMKEKGSLDDAIIIEEGSYV